ncbi:hypothetical protein [Sulfurihydrogenibium sp.]|uniref:hypothetical protein n=1 Tax=Sulfurihydrogenibium sp. TaxID=2053621 RepID=UPI002629A6C6|nr:hypothetical protein [Sulfurihydrogenibium sp.]
MNKSVDTVNLQTLSKMLQVFPTVENDAKEEFKSTIEDLIYIIKEKNKDDNFLYELTTLYEQVMKNLHSLKSDEEFLFFNFKRILNIQENILTQILENNSQIELNSTIKKLLERAKLIIEKDNRVLLTYLLEEPKRMKNILKIMDINRLLNDINEKIEDYIEGKKVVNG